MIYQQVQLGLLYFLLLTGGLWHITGLFHTIMRETAGWMIIGLGIWLLTEFFLLPEKNKQTGAETTPERLTILIFSLLVIFLTWLVEWAGVRSGIIFGRYQYGEVLQPQIAGVPVAIGFAWLTLLISAAALERLIPTAPAADRIIHRSLRIAGLMVLFDLLMEPVAVKLGYWQWAGGSIPLQNYAAWFVIGFLLSLFYLRIRIRTDKQPEMTLHFYIAQSLYFVLVYLA